MKTDSASRKPNAGNRRIFKAIIRNAYVSKDVEHVSWPSVGVAIESQSGEGFNLLIHSGLSVSGQIYLRPFAAGDDVPAFDYKPLVGDIR